MKKEAPKPMSGGRPACHQGVERICRVLRLPAVRTKLTTVAWLLAISWCVVPCPAQGESSPERDDDPGEDPGVSGSSEAPEAGSPADRLLTGLETWRESLQALRSPLSAQVEIATFQVWESVRTPPVPDQDGNFAPGIRVDELGITRLRWAQVFGESPRSWECRETGFARHYTGEFRPTTDHVIAGPASYLTVDQRDQRAVLHQRPYPAPVPTTAWWIADRCLAMPEILIELTLAHGSVVQECDSGFEVVLADPAPIFSPAPLCTSIRLRLTGYPGGAGGTGETIPSAARIQCDGVTTDGNRKCHLTIDVTTEETGAELLVENKIVDSSDALRYRKQVRLEVGSRRGEDLLRLGMTQALAKLRRDSFEIMVTDE
jgi:hypothetical protein